MVEYTPNHELFLLIDKEFIQAYLPNESIKPSFILAYSPNQTIKPKFILAYLRNQTIKRSFSACYPLLGNNLVLIPNKLSIDKEGKFK